MANHSIDRVDRFHGEAGMKQHLAHQYEERDRNQRELRDRKLLVADHLLEAWKAAEDQIGAGDVDDEEDEGNRKRRQQQPDLGREHQRQDRHPVHGISPGRMPGTCSDGSWLTGVDDLAWATNISSA